MSSYTPFNPTPNTPVQQNPHSPATNGYRQQPVEIPGVLHQTRQLFQPVTIQPDKDSK